MAWTEERIEQLKTLWKDGLSASQIARRLGGTTRNAVIGKVHRLGLPGRVVPVVRRTFSKPRRRIVKPAAPQRIVAAITPRVRLRPDFPTEPLPLPVDDYYVAPERRKGVLELTADDCRWPIGDPREPGFYFCDQRAAPGLPYCEGHCRQAYQQPEDIAAREARKRAA